MLPLLSRCATTAPRLSHSVTMLGGGADYTAVASNLFANVRLPASIVAGVLLPLTFGYPLPLDGATFDKKTQAALIKIYRVLAVWSYVCLIVCVVCASVAINSLAENPHQMAASVTDFIKAECELSWISANVNFMFGLCGALTLVALRALMTWDPEEGRVAAGFCGAAVLLTLSIVDDQVRQGGYAADLPELAVKYVQLGVGRAFEGSGSPLLVAGLVVAATSTISAGTMLNGREATRAPAADEPDAGGGASPRGAVLQSSAVTNAIVAEAEALAAGTLADAAADEAADAGIAQAASDDAADGVGADSS